MNTLTTELLNNIDAYWRAANYLSVGQIYLRDNALLREPLKPQHVKRMLLDHWGTTPSQNFIYVHLNRVIKKYDLDMIYVSGPGHGGPTVVANTYLEGTYSEVYPKISQDEAGLRPVSFNRVFTSPRRRAQQTYTLSGLTPAAEIDKDLAEWDYGDYEGRRSVDIRKERPDWNLFHDGDDMCMSKNSLSAATKPACCCASKKAAHQFSAITA